MRRARRRAHWPIPMRRRLPRCGRRRPDRGSSEPEPRCSTAGRPRSGGVYEAGLSRHTSCLGYLREPDCDRMPTPEIRRDYDSGVTPEVTESIQPVSNERTMACRYPFITIPDFRRTRRALVGQRQSITDDGDHVSTQLDSTVADARQEAHVRDVLSTVVSPSCAGNPPRRLAAPPPGVPVSAPSSPSLLWHTVA